MDGFLGGLISGLVVAVILAVGKHLLSRFYNPVVWELEKDTLDVWHIHRVGRQTAFNVALFDRVEHWVDTPSPEHDSPDIAKGETASYRNLAPKATYDLTWIEKRGRRYAAINIFENVTKTSIRRNDLKHGTPAD